MPTDLLSCFKGTLTNALVSIWLYVDDTLGQLEQGEESVQSLMSQEEIHRH